MWVVIIVLAVAYLVGHEWHVGKLGREIESFKKQLPIIEASEEVLKGLRAELKELEYELLKQKLYGLIVLAVIFVLFALTSGVYGD
ncbi:MAG: hypothetical protein AAF809_00275 [Bacteroidota bacterium]